MNKENVVKIFEDVNDLLRKKFKDKKANRFIAGVVATVIGLSGLTIGVTGKKDGKIYFRDLNDDKSQCTIYDVDGNEIETVDDVSSVATFDNRMNDSELVAVITNDGKIKLGYMNGEEIEKGYTQVVDDVEADEFTNVSIVCADNGVFLRQNKKVDRNTDDAVLLQPGTYLLGHCETETSSDNAYNWRKVIYLDGDTIRFGYIADEYLFDTDLSKFEGEIFEVNSEKVPLKLRTDPVVPKENSSSNIIEEMPHGSRVYLVPNVNSEWYDEEKQTQWLYVAYEGADGEIKFGWCASNTFVNDRTVTYLNQVVKEHIDDDIEPSKETTAADNTNNEGKKTVYMRVDTSNDDYVDLKLRKKPDLDSDVVIRLENGTNVVVSTKDWNNQIEEDGYDWVKVTTSSGKTGYVASKYLKEKIKVDSSENFVTDVVDFGVEGKVEGYIGMDFTPIAITPARLEQFLRGDVKLCSSRGSTAQKPNFVMIKIGGTGYGETQPGGQRIVDPNLYEKAFALATKCEQYGVPYSFYYYCAALPDKKDGKTTDSREADMENNYISTAIKYYIENYDSEYYMRSVYMDVEWGSIRLRNYHSPEQLTNMYNQQFNELKDSLGDLYDGSGIDVGVYTEHRATGYYRGHSPIFNLSGIEAEFTDDLWIVDPSPTHSSSWVAHPDADPDIRQIKLDCDIHGMDVDIMDKDLFDKITAKMGINDEKTESSSKGNGRSNN